MVCCFVFFSGFAYTPSFYAQDLALTKKALWEKINEVGIKFPEIVFAQALLESGDLNSRLCRIHNNLFGMKLPEKRETLAFGAAKGGYAKYKDWTHSVEDYVLFQNYVFRKKDYSKTEYLAYIGRYYSATPNYITRLKRVLNENKHLINES